MLVGAGLAFGLRSFGFTYETALFFALLAPAGFAYRHFADALARHPAAGPLVAGLAWVVFVQGDALLLGPGARLEWGDGNELFWTYFPYLDRARGEGATFLHLLAGGVGLHSVGRMGAELYSWRVWASGEMPLWALAVLTRFLVTGVAFAGAYLAARDLGGADPRASVALACLFSVGYDVTAAMTFLYGFSIAGFPLLYWALWWGRARLRDALAFASLAVVYVGAADPLYWLPVFWIVGAAVFLVRAPADPRFCLAGAVGLGALWVANYAVAIYEILAFVPDSARALYSQTLDFAQTFVHLADWSFKPLPAYNRGGWPMFLTLALCLLAAPKDARAAAACVLLLGLGLFSAGARAVPFDAVGLAFLNTYNWYVEYGAFAFAVVAGAAAAAALARRAPGAPPYVAAAIFAVAVGQAGVMRVGTLVDSYYRGGVARASEIPNLRAPDWYAGPLWRAVSVGGYPFANTPANHGIATYDGTSTFFPARAHLYWRDGILRGAMLQSLELQIAPDWAYWTGAAPRALGERADLDLLRIANVRYVLSAAPLADPELRLVSGPASGRAGGPPVPRSLFDIRDPGMRAALRDPPPVHVYELDGALPRAYAAREIVAVSDDTAPAVYPLIARLGRARGIALARADADAFAVGPAEVASIELRPDGFAIALDGAQGASVVVNTPHIPHWEARAGARVLAIAPANVAQIVVAVPPGVDRFELVYRRAVDRRR